MPRPVERPGAREKSSKRHDYPLVAVEWVDCVTSAAWEHVIDLNSEFQLPLIQTVGYVVADTAEHLSVAGSVQAYEDVSDQICNLMTIPRGCIKSVVKLRKGGAYALPKS